MKKFYFFLLLCCVPFLANAQCFVQITSVSPTCFGNCDGSATAYPAGGTAPYAFLWNPGGQTTQTATNLCAGNYAVNVADANGCITQGTVTITQPAQIVVTLSPTNASCSSCCDGNIVSTVTGGTPPYTYMWNTTPPQTTPVAQAVCPGTYTLCVTDMNGCSSCNTATVNFPTSIKENTANGTLFVFPSPAVNSVTVEQTFANAQAAEISVYNVLGERFYVDNSTAETELKKTISIAGLPAGIYFVSVKTSSGVSVQRFIKQ